jgi:radical SAM enzyme (TIGR01210 family)
MAALTPIAERAVVAARGPRAARDPTRPYAHFVERERSADGRVEDVAAVFLTNKECPFRCLVCDLWKNATPERVPDGAVAGQVAWALARLRETPHVKLYNGGSFFDAQAIPEPDVARIAALLPGKRSVIVECHPKLVDERCLVFAEAIAPARLELAMGLETVDPDVLPFIKPDMSLDDFAGAARFLIERDIAVRAFVLLGPPGQRGAARVHWARRSLDYAFSLGVGCCVVIPVRPGNGIVDALERQGQYAKPTLAELQAVVEYGVGLRRGRAFADLWDVERFLDCPRCGPARVAALEQMSLTQRPAPRIECSCTGTS